MIDGMVKKWVRQFNEQQTDVNNVPLCGWSSFLSDDLLGQESMKKLKSR